MSAPRVEPIESQWREQCRRFDERARKALEGCTFGQKLNKYAGISRYELRQMIAEELERRKREDEEPSRVEKERQLRIAAHYFMFGIILGLKPAIRNRERRPAPQIVMRHIMTEVCDKHGVTLEQLKGSRRSHFITKARKEFYYRACTETSAALPHIGKICGNRDHTTVLHGACAYADENGLPRHNEANPQFRGAI